MRSSRSSTAAAVFFGVLAIAAIPAGIFASRDLGSVSLLQSLYVSVPVACLLGLVAIFASRRARFRAARSLFSGNPRLAPLIAWTGLWTGVTGGVALAVYGLLRLGQ